MIHLLIIIIIFIGSNYIIIKSICHFISFNSNDEKYVTFLLGLGIITWCFLTYQVYIELLKQINTVIGVL